MKTLKMYENLTVNYKFAIFVVSLLFSFNVFAAETPAAPAVTVTVQRVITEKSKEEVEREEAKAKVDACNTSISALDAKMSSIKSACSSTKLGSSCLDDILKCENGSGTSEMCDKIQSIEESSTKDELDNEIEQLQKQKEKLEDKKDKLVEKEDEIKSDIEEIEEEKKELSAKKDESAAELKDKIEEEKTIASQKAAELQSAVEALQDEISNTYEQAVAARLKLTDLIAESRLQCNAEGAARSQQFVEYFRACIAKGGNCKVNQAGILGAGSRSLNDLGTNYARKYIRKCMSISNNTTFGVRYQAESHKIATLEGSLGRQRQRLAIKQGQLKVQIQQVALERSQKEANELLNKANQDVILTKQETDASVRALFKAAELTKLAEEKEKLQKEIDEKEDAIRKKEKEKASALSDDKLSNFKSALADVSTLVDTAKDIKSCGCIGSIKTLNNVFGGVCEESTSSPTSVAPTQELLDATAE